MFADNPTPESTALDVVDANGPWLNTLQPGDIQEANSPIYMRIRAGSLS